MSARGVSLDDVATGRIPNGAAAVESSNSASKIVWCPLHQEWVVQIGDRNVGRYPRRLEAEYAAMAVAGQEAGR